MPSAYSDGTCTFCREGLHTSCIHGGFFGAAEVGAQAEALRVPYADGTLFVLPVAEDDALMPSRFGRWIASWGWTTSSRLVDQSAIA